MDISGNKPTEQKILYEIYNYKWDTQIIRSIAIKYTQSILHDSLYKSDSHEYLRRWYNLRNGSVDKSPRFPEDMIHDIIRKNTGYITL